MLTLAKTFVIVLCMRGVQFNTCKKQAKTDIDATKWIFVIDSACLRHLIQISGSTMRIICYSTKKNKKYLMLAFVEIFELLSLLFDSFVRLQNAMIL